MKNAAYEFKLTRRVEFSDTDMASIMHFSNFFRFMETAETAFFRSLGLSIYGRDSNEPLGWPRVHADCNFRHPLHFEDVVEIHLLVRKKKKKSIVYTFIFRRLNEKPVREVAWGSLTVACVKHDNSNGRMIAVPIPLLIMNKLAVAPPELLNRIDERGSS